MHLYHSQYTRSGRARWILEEIGVAYDIAVASAIGWLAFIGVLADHPKLAAYLQPMQQRPAYQRSIAD